MNENKALICEKLGELLRLTRGGANIDKLEYDEEKDLVVVYDDHKYSPWRLNVAGDSGMQMIADIIKGVWG